MIFRLGAPMAFYEGVEKILHAEPARYVVVNFIVLGASIVFEAGSWFVAFREFPSSARSARLAGGCAAQQGPDRVHSLVRGRCRYRARSRGRSASEGSPRFPDCLSNPPTLTLDPARRDRRQFARASRLCYLPACFGSGALEAADLHGINQPFPSRVRSRRRPACAQ